jgi:hypothetical protein
MKKYIASMLLAYLLCSCATTHLTAKEEHIIRNVAFLASFDIVCFEEEIIVRKLSARLYEARCIANGRITYYTVIGSEITRVR